MTGQSLYEQTHPVWTVTAGEPAVTVELELSEFGHIYLFDRLKELSLPYLVILATGLHLPPAPPGMPRFDIEFAVAGIVQERWFQEVHKTVPESVEQSRAATTARYKELVDAINRGEYDMAKTEKTAKVKKVKAPKELLITRYTLTAKKSAMVEKMLNEETKTHNAVIYRTIAGMKEPPTFEELSAAIDKRSFGSESKNVESIMRWHVQDLRKKGFIRSTEEKEEVAAA